MYKKTAISLMLMMGLAGLAGAGLFATARAAPPTNTLIYATGAGPVSMDPVYSWDSASDDVIDQVCQPLLWYNVTEPNYPLEGLLAANWTVSANSTQYTFNLRQGVEFQDGTPFNASAVVWNWERLNYFVNLPNATQTETASLYILPGGGDIINNVWAVGNYQVVFNLTVPYGPFLQLMTFNSLDMLSPTSLVACHCQYQYLQYSSSKDNMTGTGPYTFGSYSATLGKVYLTANPLYWGQPAKIHYVVFDVISTSQTLDATMLDKADSFSEATLPSDIATANSTPGLTLDNGPQTLVIQYISMNTALMNETFRNALAYCFDYNYFLSAIELNLTHPLTGVIPDGMNFYNGSIPHPYLNLTYARTLLIDAKLLPGISLPANDSLLTNDTFWMDIATASPFSPTGYINPVTHEDYATAPLASYSFYYNADNSLREQVATLMWSDAMYIGINVTTYGTSWTNFLTLLVTDPMHMDMFCLGWAPDYNDPDDYVSPLLLMSSSDGAYPIANDPTIFGNASEARSTTSAAIRQSAYNNITTYIGENASYIWLNQGISRDLHLTTLKGFPDNPFLMVYFSYCYYSSTTTAIPGFDVSLVSIAVMSMMVAIIVVKRKKLMS
jgi:peptide/nickel transport system substrate-binding protein